MEEQIHLAMIVIVIEMPGHWKKKCQGSFHHRLRTGHKIISQPVTLNIFTDI